VNNASGSEAGSVFGSLNSPDPRESGGGGGTTELGSGVRTRILVVEDDESIALGLQMNLEAEGYAVETVADGETGLERALTESPDLIILDVMLPRQNGFEVVAHLRDQGSRVPVVMLSARGSETDKVMGLNLGAEDYITKPFGLAELLARVNAVLRRAELHRDRRKRGEPEQEPEDVTKGARKFKDLLIDPKVRQVSRSGEPITLTATEFDILWCLVTAEGQVLSREEIQSRVWGPEHHGTLRTIDNFLLQLRAKLETDPANPCHLLTVRGVGYRFAP
jgi:two-component system, OmpR family, alkaline phosphatase synthesis response regulator PhoP